MDRRRGLWLFVARLRRPGIHEQALRGQPLEHDQQPFHHTVVQKG
jgi:hypothetical protein